MTANIETYLNSLPEDILTINISCKNIKSLPNLTRFNNLTELICSDNQLTSLPTLPQKLEVLYCANNKLTSLPNLPQNLEILDCYHNQLTSLPTIPENLKILGYVNNPIYEIVNNSSFIKIKQNIQILNNFRHLYNSLKLRNWLWEKVLKPKIEQKYHPNYLIENLGDEDDLDTLLDNWK